MRDGLAPDALEGIFTLDTGGPEQGILVNLERGRINQAEFVAHLASRHWGLIPTGCWSGWSPTYARSRAAGDGGGGRTAVPRGHGCRAVQ